MYIFILTVHIIVSLELVATILLQAGKGGGLAETFGGGGGSQATIFGQKASTFLTKATTVSAILFLCTALSLAFLSSKKQKSIMEGVKIAPIVAEEAVAPEEAKPLEQQAQEQATEEAKPAEK